MPRSGLVTLYFNDPWASAFNLTKARYVKNTNYLQLNDFYSYTESGHIQLGKSTAGNMLFAFGSNGARDYNCWIARIEESPARYRYFNEEVYYQQSHKDEPQRVVEELASRLFKEKRDLKTKSFVPTKGEKYVAHLKWVGVDALIGIDTLDVKKDESVTFRWYKLGGRY